MQRKGSHLFFLSFLLFVFSATTAQQLTEKIPFDAKVKTGKLENGLTYFIRPNQKPEKRVELRLVVNAGAINEDEDQLGLAHMTEHMAFNGTKNFKKNDIVSYLQEIGVGFGNDLNAYTSTRIYNYSASLHTITANRIKSFYRTSDIQAGTLATVMDFKRAEFVQEGMRWFDLLRYKIPVVHSVIEGPTLTLKADDPMRVFQIPDVAKQAGIAQNPR